MTLQPQSMTCMSLINGACVATNHPLPVPDTDHVLIAVKAAGLNRADLLQRRGLYPPPTGASDIMGLEVSGTIIACGPNVTDWHIGDPVCALLQGGGYASHALAHISCLLPKPDNYSWAEAAALPEALFTVWNNVFVRGGLAHAETILITGGSSGIGTLAIQMAKQIAGAQIITLCKASKAGAVQALGADIIRDYTDPSCYDALPPVHVVLDMIGGQDIARHMQVMATDGRHVNIAYLAGQAGTIDIQMLMRKRLTLTGSTLRGRPWHEIADLRHGIMARAYPHIQSSAIRPVVDQTFPLRQVDTAQETMARGEHIGKIVLTIDE